jgi:hypothetical protein
VDHSREDQLKFAKHFERAQGWLLLDKFDRAIEALAEIPPAFQLYPEAILLRADIHLAAGKWVQAEPLLRQLVGINSGESQYWHFGSNMALYTIRVRPVTRKRVGLWVHPVG